MIELSQTQAKRLVVNRQGLHKSNAFGRGDSAILECIERLGYVQLDTISVINRAHHHTFWSRIPKYRVDQLDSLQRERKIFEYWPHAAAYLPMQDFRFSLPYMNAIAGGQKHWRTPDKAAMKAVLKRIASEGALKARDFETGAQSLQTQSARRKKKVDLWGGAKPAKKALEQLFIEGKLLISHRNGFQKVFDLPERVLPADLDISTPTTEEFSRHLIARTIESQGIATEAEIGYLRKGIMPDLRSQVLQMIADNEIVEIRVHGNKSTYYSRHDIVEQAPSARVAKRVHLLSPFDNIVIQRKRLAKLFDYDYQIECYVPEAKRAHGYFCLPILFGDEFVGRLDPKADRKNRTMQIRNLVIEKKVERVDAFITELARKINHFAMFNGCENTKIDRCNIKKIGSALSRLI